MKHRTYLQSLNTQILCSRFHRKSVRKHQIYQERQEVENLDDISRGGIGSSGTK